jgi:hypothetical protein
MGCVLSILTGCHPQSSVEWHDEDLYRWRSLAVDRSESVGFTQMPPSNTGLMFVNRVSQEPRLWASYVGHGSGVALGDVDGDGLVDIYLTSIEGPNTLYLNQGGWRFEEVAAERGVTAPGRPSTGAVLADIDGDGDLDLLTTALGGPNSLFVNDGTGRFTEQGAEHGLESDRSSGTITLADVDGDNDLDLYIANYKIGSARDEPGREGLSFDSIVRQVGDTFEIAPEFREFYRIRQLPELGIVAHTERAESDWFYLNDGTGRFEQVPFTGGRFRDENGRPLAEEPDYFSLAARFYDVDLDGDPDLYVCNDFEDPDLFWINDGTGHFQLISPLAVRATSSATMAVDFADIDRDGDVDFFTTDMLGRELRTRKAQRPSYTPLPKLVGNNENRPQTQRNTLFLNRGDNTFAQIAEYAGVEASDWTWSTLFLDVDLDGFEDILVTTGHLWDQFDDDYVMSMRRMPAGLDWREKRSASPKLDTKNYIFRNNGDLTFDDVSTEWGFANEKDVSHGPATADLDGDGDLDVVINRLGFPVGVFRNNASAARVAVRLLGKAPNTKAIGAKVTLLGGPVPQQQREVTAGGLFLSGSDQLLTFAAGEATDLSIVVDWRSGTRTTIAHVQPNRLYEIREQDAEIVGKADGNATPTLFTDISRELGHVHRDRLFDDYARQPLLPNKLSQLGPGVTWYDVDGDGDADLLLPTGGGGKLAFFRNNNGSFGDIELGQHPAATDQTTVLAMPNQDGTTELLVGQSAYELPTASEAIRVPSVVEFTPGRDRRATARAVIPGQTSSTGPMALADVDGDGDLDLFVGGRVIPTAYPVPATSRLFLNQDGGFALDSASSKLLSDIGLISSAVFSDIDGDGDADLLLAQEWGPVRLLTNEQGRLVERTEEWGLSPYSSRWNGITTGDLNSDGLLDIVATSWGRNTELRASPSRPLLLYYSDFDRNGTMDLVEAQFDDQAQAIVPLEETRLRLVHAIPFVARRIPNSTTYADATLEEVLGDRLTEVTPLETTTLDHLVFINLGDRFEAVPLPAEAQLAPAFYAGIADFNGDGHEDLFLAQNFYPTAITSPRYDAGRGLLLLGDGSGDLIPVPGQVSGIRAYGDQRGAGFADFDGDGRVDIAVSQNGRETKLYHNDAATPGLRVRLIGPPGNPHAFGAVLRLVYSDRLGPAREVHGGSGYWSQDDPLQVLGGPVGATAVRVRWPGGTEAEVALEPGQKEVIIRSH